MTDFRTQSFEERFTDKIVIDSLDVCWLPKVRTGHRPNISYKGVGRLMSHLVLEELCGLPRPLGLVACHSCDVSDCCNPAHLRWDSYAANNLDAVKRGRWVGPTGKHWKYSDEQRRARSGRNNGRYVDGKHAKN